MSDSNSSFQTYYYESLNILFPLLVFFSRISFANILCFKWCRTDGDAQISSYSYKPCYREVQSQAGFSGDGYITYGKDSGIDRRRTFVEHSLNK